MLSSVQELVHAKKFARELGVFDQMEFILADTPDKVRVVVCCARTGTAAPQADPLLRLPYMLHTRSS